MTIRSKPKKISDRQKNRNKEKKTNMLLNKSQIELLRKPLIRLNEMLPRLEGKKHRESLMKRLWLNLNNEMLRIKREYKRKENNSNGNKNNRNRLANYRQINDYLSFNRETKPNDNLE